MLEPAFPRSASPPRVSRSVVAEVPSDPYDSYSFEAHGRQPVLQRMPSATPKSSLTFLEASIDESYEMPATPRSIPSRRTPTVVSSVAPSPSVPLHKSLQIVSSSDVSQDSDDIDASPGRSKPSVPLCTFRVAACHPSDYMCL